MNLEPSVTLGKSMNVEVEEKKEKRRKTKTFLLPEDKLDKYLTYEVEPILPALVERDPAEGARLEEIRQRLIVELDRMRREYQATGRITYELEVTDDEQEEGNQMEVKNVEENQEPDAAAPPLVSAPIISVERSSRRRFRQGIVKRAGGGGYEKIV